MADSSASPEPTVTGIRQHALQLLARLRQRDKHPKEKTDEDDEGDDETQVSEIIDYGNPYSHHPDGYETASTSFSQQFSRGGDEEEGFVTTDDEYTDGNEENDDDDEESYQKVEAEHARAWDHDQGDEARQQALKLLNIVGDYGLPQPSPAFASLATAASAIQAPTARSRRVGTHSGEEARSGTSGYGPQQQQRRRRRARPATTGEEGASPSGRPPAAVHLPSPSSTKRAMKRLSKHLRRRMLEAQTTRNHADYDGSCARLLGIVALSMVLAGIIYVSLL